MIFTAIPEAGYVVDKWTVTGGTLKQNTSIQGSTSATVTLTANTTVTVTFTYKGEYTLDNVPFKMIKIPEVTNAELTSGHTVSLTAYAIAETEVTYQLYQKVMHNGTGDTKPMSNVSWVQCIAFCNELTKKVYGDESECVYYTDEEYTKIYTQSSSSTESVYANMDKKGFRLPTEAEWMYAAKGGKNGLFAGSEETDLNNIAWYSDNSKVATSGHLEKHAVKTKEANGYGLYDMCGNICEWCWNDGNSTDDESLEGKDPTGKKEDFVLKRVLKGGSYFSKLKDNQGKYSSLDLMQTDSGIFKTSHASYGLRIVCRPL